MSILRNSEGRTGTGSMTFTITAQSGDCVILDVVANSVSAFGGPAAVTNITWSLVGSNQDSSPYRTEIWKGLVSGTVSAASCVFTTVVGAIGAGVNDCYIAVDQTTPIENITFVAEPVSTTAYSATVQTVYNNVNVIGYANWHGPVGFTVGSNYTTANSGGSISVSAAGEFTTAVVATPQVFTADGTLSGSGSNGMMVAISLRMQSSTAPTSTKPISDSVAFSESLKVTATEPIADSVAFSETPVVTATNPIADSVAFGDGVTITSDIGISDAVVFDDSVIIIQGDLPIAEILTFTDTPVVTATISISDSFSFTENAIITGNIPIAETITFDDSTLSVNAEIDISELLMFVDIESITADIDIIDTLDFADNSGGGVNTHVLLNDDFAFIDTIAVSVQVPVADTVAFLDSDIVIKEIFNVGNIFRNTRFRR